MPAMFAYKLENGALKKFFDREYATILLEEENTDVFVAQYDVETAKWSDWRKYQPEKKATRKRQQYNNIKKVLDLRYPAGSDRLTNIDGLMKALNKSRSSVYYILEQSKEGGIYRDYFVRWLKESKRDIKGYKRTRKLSKTKSKISYNKYIVVIIIK